MPDASFVDEEVLKRVPKWRNYLAAKLGFRNHWYPVKFSRDISEGQVIEATLCGEDILLKRIDGKVYAMRNKCIHRGVKLSRKIECYTKGTITCWYHGFTYKWDNTGVVCDIIAVPNWSVIGKRKIKVYPGGGGRVGLIFHVFLGDDGVNVPPLGHDVPPWFLDEDMHIQGYAYPVNSNWRIGCENGFDGLHVYIHRESPLVPNTQRSLPLGHVTVETSYEVIEPEQGPKGVLDNFASHKSFYEGYVEGRVVVSGTKMHTSADGEKKKRTTGASLWLPCALRVDGFPYFDLNQFEWYVPVTANTHLYIITLGKRCTNSEERTQFEHDFWHRWKPVSLEGFNNQDVMAREAMQSFYGKRIPDGSRRVSSREDLLIVKWRELCHRHNRGLQLPKHIS